MPYIVKAMTASGAPAWIKRKAGPYRLGPRDQATAFLTPESAREAIRDLPDTVRNSAEFTVEAADQTD